MYANCRWPVARIINKRTQARDSRGLRYGAARAAHVAILIIRSDARLSHLLGGDVRPWCCRWCGYACANSHGDVVHRSTDEVSAPLIRRQISGFYSGRDRSVWAGRSRLVELTVSVWTGELDWMLAGWLCCEARWVFGAGRRDMYVRRVRLWLSVRVFIII